MGSPLSGGQSFQLSQKEYRIKISRMSPNEKFIFLINPPSGNVKIQKLTAKHIYKSVCCLMHDIRNRKVPSNILNLFSDTTSIHSYNTRSSPENKFYIKKSRLEIQRAFSRVGAKIWNEMPASLRELPKKHFQTKLHSFLLDFLKRH